MLCIFNSAANFRPNWMASISTEFPFVHRNFSFCCCMEMRVLINSDISILSFLAVWWYIHFFMTSFSPECLAYSKVKLSENFRFSIESFHMLRKNVVGRPENFISVIWYNFFMNTVCYEGFTIFKNVWWAIFLKIYFRIIFMISIFVFCNRQDIIEKWK